MSEDQTRRVSFSAKHIKLLANAVSKEETRYFLQGVQATPHPAGVVLVATNGHRLVAILDRAGSANGEWICPIPAAVLTAARKKDACQVSFIGDTVHVTTAYMEFDDAAVIGHRHLVSIHAPALDGVYPDWGKLAPAPAATRLGLNPALIADLPGTGVSLHLPAAPGYPFLVTTDSDKDIVGMVMPMHDRNSQPRVPDWFTKLCPPKAAPKNGTKTDVAPADGTPADRSTNPAPPAHKAAE